MRSNTVFLSHSEPVPTGVAIMLHQDNYLLLGRRSKLPMIGAWQLPGGWLRQDENVDQCLQRLLAGFTGLNSADSRFQTYTDNHFDDGQRSISLYFSLDCQNKVEPDLEPNSLCSDWAWFDCYDLPDGLFLPLQQLAEKFDWTALNNHIKGR
jgi:ADP-ribose pyrophosphatase YjhB (NUDIX family)